MKKILLGTTAVVAATAFAGQSFAADPIQVGMSGFVNAWYGDINHEQGADANETSIGLFQRMDSEIRFSGSTTLDNGLSVGVNIDLEGNPGDATHSDRSSITISSADMGALDIGTGFGTAAGSQNVRAPHIGPMSISGGALGVQTYATDGDTNTAFALTAGNDDEISDADELRTRYTTPNFNGFTASVSYAASNNINNDTRLTSRAATHEEKSIGLGWAGEISGASVDVGLVRTDIQNNQETTAFGASVSMSGFTIGGNYADVDDDTNTDGGATNINSQDGKQWELGVGYATGPYSVAVTYATAEAKATTTAGDDEDTEWHVGASYNMGAGVSLVGQYFDAEADPEGTAAKNDVSGVIAGIQVSF